MMTETQEQELKDLFTKLPKVTYNGSTFKVDGEDVKMINYALLLSITKHMMAKAYYDGQMDAVEDVQDSIISTFK